MGKLILNQVSRRHISILLLMFTKISEAQSLFFHKMYTFCPPLTKSKLFLRSRPNTAGAKQCNAGLNKDQQSVMAIQKSVNIVWLIF